MSHVPDVRRRGVGLYAAVVALWCMLVPRGAAADQFTGKVVGISDGDTISVLREGKAVKGLWTKRPPFPPFVVQDGMRHQKSAQCLTHVWLA